MTPAEQYRARAAEIKAKARFAEDRASAAEWNTLADCYLRLAEEAERIAEPISFTRLHHRSI
jgi:hypothetical protein